MRKGSSPTAKQSSIPYNPSDLEAGEQLLEKFSEWNKKLSHLAQLSEPDQDTEHNRPSRPCWKVRGFVQILHNAIARLQQCSCNPTHDYMLFLATHRQFKENHPYISFNMLLGTSDNTKQIWKESKVFFMLSDKPEAACPQFMYSTEKGKTVNLH
jgi:hypothetical protein